jgi:uncharacterized FlgJ-related protein
MTSTTEEELVCHNQMRNGNAHSYAKPDALKNSVSRYRKTLNSHPEHGTLKKAIWQPNMVS